MEEREQEGAGGLGSCAPSGGYYVHWIISSCLSIVMSVQFLFLYHLLSKKWKTNVRIEGTWTIINIHPAGYESLDIWNDRNALCPSEYTILCYFVSIILYY